MILCYIVMVAEVGYMSCFELTKDTPYLAFTGEIWSVLCERVWRKKTML